MTNNTSMYVQLRSKLAEYVPETVIDLLLVMLLLGMSILFIKYNVPLLKWLTKTIIKIRNVIYKLTSKTATEVNKKMHRSALIHQEQHTSKIINYLDELIVDMDMYKDGVTAFGLLLFLGIITLFFTIILSLIFNLGILSILAFIAVGFVVFTIFKVLASAKVEHREALIMDVEDLLVSDLTDGVYNAIVRYKDVGINPEIACYFQAFVENVAQNGWTFTRAMQQLNKELGPAFTDFATKAILYEQTGDAETLEIFSAIIDMNAHKRRLREQNNIVFNEVKLAFIICLIITVGALIVMCLFDANVRSVFLDSNIGRIMAIADVFIVAGALARLSALKNQHY